MSIRWIPLADEKPPEGEYVLIWVPSMPWTDPSPSVFAQVAKRHDDAELYCWRSFGPGSYRDLEVTHWARIQPPLEEET
jgi:hypothetical protein